MLQLPLVTNTTLPQIPQPNHARPSSPWTRANYYRLGPQLAALAAISLCTLATGPLAAQQPASSTARPAAPQQRTATAQSNQPATGKTTGPRVAQQPAAARSATNVAATTPGAAVAGQAAANSPLAPLPAWHPLPADQQQRVQQILAAWEQESAKIKTFRSQFVRWEYDPVFGVPNSAYYITIGEIRFAAPDKGLYHETKKGFYNPPAEGQTKPSYQPRKLPSGEEEPGEYWICTGSAVYQFVASNKLVTKTMLPQELQGQGITDGPLPFVFSAKADKLQRRYWIRELPSNQERQELVLEFVPRYQEDLQNFTRAEVSLSLKQKLPVSLKLDRNQQKNGLAYTAWQLKETDVNGMVDQWQKFIGGFVAPKTPNGWREVVEDYRQPAAEVQAAAPADAQR
jgi:TIGR03009 family protein